MPSSGADGPGQYRGFPLQTGLGELHGRGHQAALKGALRDRIPAVGEVCAGQSAAHRPDQAPRPHGGSSLGTVSSAPPVYGREGKHVIASTYMHGLVE